MIKSPLQEKKEEPFNIVEWIDFFAERYGWSMKEVLELPIPTFYALLDVIKKKNELEKKELNKGKK